MLIDFFESGSPNRSVQERTEILQKLDPQTTATPSYQEFGFDYFDNPEIGVGYGGYTYDGRYKPAVEAMVKHYGLTPGERVLEIGCAKGFILVEFHKLGFEVSGIDASEYAVENAHPEVKDKVAKGDICKLPFEDNSFALVYAKDVLPHVSSENMLQALQECQRVSKKNTFFEIGYGQTDEGLELMSKWDATHKTVRKPEWWESIFSQLKQESDRHYKPLF